MDTPDRNPFPSYSFRDELIDSILELNNRFAKAPDRLTRDELDPLPDAALEAAFFLQRKLLADWFAERASKHRTDTRTSATVDDLTLASGVKIANGRLVWRYFDA